MNLLSLGPYIALFSGLAGAIYALMKFPREDAGLVVEQQSTALADALKLNEHLQQERDYIQTRLVAVREERDELERQLTSEKQKSRQIEENLRMCIAEQSRLEQALIELGEDPGHAEV